jgi:hypothetical protein
MSEPRLIPKKRTAVDGKVWWCVYDTIKNDWSTLIHFGKYKTKKACQMDIDFWTKEKI